jgi:hypothetical protein
MRDDEKKGWNIFLKEDLTNNAYLFMTVTYTSGLIVNFIHLSENYR